jgi:hypothetical protein
MATDRTPGDLGSKLRDARERRGLSLRQIANTTKITVAALDALERNDVSRLPGGIFSRAFVRSFAIEVGLNPEEAIQEFIAQFPNDTVTGRLQTRPAEDTGNFLNLRSNPVGKVGNVGNAGSLGPPESPEDRNVAVGKRRIAPGFLMIILSVFAGGSALYLGTRGRGVAAPIVAPAVDLVLKERDHVRGFLHGARRAPGTSIPAPPPAVTAPVDISTPAGSTPAEARGPVVSPREQVKHVENVESLENARNNAPSVTPANRASAESLTVVLSAKRPCWVSATADGRKAIDRLLLAGERRTIELRGELVVTAADASALTMTLNGADARPLGKPGEVVTVRLNPTNFREYLRR